MQHHILIIEDNKKIASLIAQSLASNPNFTIYTAYSLTEARRYLEEHPIDLICLDLILPDGDGLTLCKQIREHPKLHNIKIIVVSQRNQVNDRVTILNQAIDDYLPKPFFPDELNARIKNLLCINRMGKAKNTIEGFRLDMNKSILLYEDCEFILTETELIILKALFTNSGFVAKERLGELLSMHKQKNINDKALHVAIKRLRDKVKRRTGKVVLQNKYGSGYYLSRE